MRRAAVAALALIGPGVVAPAVGSAAAPPHEIDIQFAVFSPTPQDVLPGETVEWRNVSDRRHTVYADDGSFASGDLLGGDHFTQTFSSVGAHPYHCTVHPGMIGEIDVRRVTLDALPAETQVPGSRVLFSGRTATPGRPVTIERDTGTGYRVIGTAVPGPDGAWKTSLAARATGAYRAVTGADTSEVRHLLVSAQKLAVRATKRGVTVSAAPAAPYARIALQEYLRARFGWWIVRRAELDYVSSASFRVTRPARVRVVMLAKDGWTPIATSRVLSLKRPRTAR